MTHDEMIRTGRASGRTTKTVDAALHAAAAGKHVVIAVANDHVRAGVKAMAIARSYYLGVEVAALERVRVLTVAEIEDGGVLQGTRVDAFHDDHTAVEEVVRQWEKTKRRFAR